MSVNTTSSSSDSLHPPMIDGYFGFYPIKGLEYAALALFIILFFMITILNIKHKTWFMMALSVGALLEILGFVFRIYNTFHPMSEAGYIIYLVSVLVAPTVLAAADYSLASLVMNRGKISFCCFTPKVVKWIFLICDLFAFVLQGLGGAVAGSAKSLSQIHTGTRIILVGLAISLAVFVIFLFIALGLHLAIKKRTGKMIDDHSWMRIFYVVYANMIFLTIRAFYRVVEFHSGSTRTSLSTNEAYFYVLDVLMMMSVIGSWVFFHPSRFGVTKDIELGGENEMKGMNGNDKNKRKNEGV